jgi:hypothetical protein
VGVEFWVGGTGKSFSENASLRGVDVYPDVLICDEKTASGRGETRATRKAQSRRVEQRVRALVLVVF